MDPIRFSIEKPVTVIVGIILVVLFGWIGLTSLPYQLSPSVIEPEITVRTTWSGATPYEIEREIIEEQEKDHNPQLEIGTAAGKLLPFLPVANNLYGC